MISAVSAQGNRPYARFVCHRRSFLCLILLQRRNSPLATRHSFIPSEVEGPLSFSRIMFPSNPFRSNTYKTFCKCSFQKTYSKAKSFRMRTYKKTGGGDPIHYLVASLHPCPLSSRRRAVGAPLFSNGKHTLSLFSSYRCRTLSFPTRGGTPPPPTTSRSVTAACSASAQSACTYGQIVLEAICPSPPDSLSSPSYKMDLTRPKGLTRKE
jgi:hypothetical protein